MPTESLPTLQAQQPGSASATDAPLFNPPAPPLRTDQLHRAPIKATKAVKVSRIAPDERFKALVGLPVKYTIYTMDDPSMDEFAQTRGADDLFDDEIIPVTAEEQQVQTEVIPEPESKPAPEPEPVKPVAQPEETPVPEKSASPRGEASQRGRGGDRGRGRGRGKGKTSGRGGGGGGLSESRWAEPKRAAGPPQSKSKSSTPTTEPEAAPEEPAAKPNKAEEAEKPQPTQDEEEKGDATSANGADAVRTPAVRGDRSATGGVRKVSVTTARFGC